ncbi:MAG: hypothetical protein SVK08_00465 [Halobacteriota archaeon]|nr:hypothetical protein [Halobacteriota archaeon]
MGTWFFINVASILIGLGMMYLVYYLNDTKKLTFSNTETRTPMLLMTAIGGIFVLGGLSSTLIQNFVLIF